MQVDEGPVRELATTNTLHSVVHQAGGSDVFTLRETAHGLAATSTMHTEVHQSDGSGVVGGPYRNGDADAGGPRLWGGDGGPGDRALRL